MGKKKNKSKKNTGILGSSSAEMLFHREEKVLS
jgi:hypothetical protein